MLLPWGEVPFLYTPSYFYFIVDFKFHLLDKYKSNKC